MTLMIILVISMMMVCDGHLKHFVRTWFDSRNKVSRAESNLLHLATIIIMILMMIMIIDDNDDLKPFQPPQNSFLDSCSM